MLVDNYLAHLLLFKIIKNEHKYNKDHEYIFVPVNLCI